jgi:hypothetical protein
MKITVEKKKKSVIVVDWGHAPFAIQEKQGRRVYIPDGFTVESFCFNRLWIGQTSVRGDAIQYQFFLKNEPHKTSGWQKSASAALAVANDRIKNRFYKPGSNGALVIGVTYPNLQEEITRRFGSSLDKAGSRDQGVVEEEDEEEMDNALHQQDEQQFAFDEDQPSSTSMPAPPTRASSRRREQTPAPVVVFQEDMEEEDIESQQEADGLEPISLDPFKEEAGSQRMGGCGSLEAELKAMHLWFGNICQKANQSATAAAGSLTKDFGSLSFEQSQDPDFFLHSNDPLDL